MHACMCVRGNDGKINGKWKNMQELGEEERWGGDDGGRNPKSVEQTQRGNVWMKVKGDGDRQLPLSLVSEEMNVHLVLRALGVVLQ